MEQALCESPLADFLAQKSQNFAREHERHADEEALKRVEDDEDVPNNRLLRESCDESEKPGQPHDKSEFGEQRRESNVLFVVCVHHLRLASCVSNVSGGDGEENKVGQHDDEKRETEEESEGVAVSKPTRTITQVRVELK